MRERERRESEERERGERARDNFNYYLCKPVPRFILLQRSIIFDASLSLAYMHCEQTMVIRTITADLTNV